MASFGEVLLGFDFFGEERQFAVVIGLGDAGAALGIEQLEIDFEELGKIDERKELGLADKIVESQEIAGRSAVRGRWSGFRRWDSRFPGFRRRCDLAGASERRRGAGQVHRH